jgi:hypothetical protein
MTILARQRFIHPSIWDDKKIAKLSFVERLFFIGCFSNADDDGRLIGDPAYLRSIIFKYDDLSLEEVRQIRDNVVLNCKNLILYVVDDEEYLTFSKWKDYQKPKYPTPSKIPPFPGRFPEDSRNDSRKIDGSTPQLVGLGLGRVGLGSDLDKDLNKTAAATNIVPIVTPELQKPVAADADAVDVAAATNQSKNPLDVMDELACEVLGRVCTSPLDVEAMKQMLVATGGDTVFIRKKVMEIKSAYKPQYKGAKIRSFSYFLSGVLEAAALQKARAEPLQVSRGHPPEQEMTEEEKARSEQLTKEIMALLPPSMKGG